ncbi:MAG: oxaloacetate decarboxylase, partial [Treponema sp.]|nr:oxaloacetate decarboxylase [Treponema sp.]
VFNVIQGRYKMMTADFANLVTGKFGALPTAANPDVVAQGLAQNKMTEVMTCRPADKIEPEWNKMVEESKAAGGDGSDEDVLTYAMFPQVATKFFKERAKGPVDAAATFAKKEAAPAKENKGGSYTINVNGTAYNVTTGPAGDTMNVNVNGTAYNVTFGAAGAAPAVSAAPAASAPVVTGGVEVAAPVAGTLLKYVASEGAQVKKGDTVIMVESMKMELEVKAPADGKISFKVQPGTQISAGQVLAVLGGTAAPAPAAPVAPAPAAAPAAAPAPAPAASTGGKPVNAPVAGTLLKYAVSEGDSVSPDTTVIIVESMKMELEIKAGNAGKVHFVAQPGTQISAGQVLAEVK